MSYRGVPETEMKHGILFAGEFFWREEAQLLLDCQRHL
jgi:hypothetical protein